MISARQDSEPFAWIILFNPYNTLRKVILWIHFIDEDTEMTPLVNSGAGVQSQLLTNPPPPAPSGPGDSGAGAVDHQSTEVTDLSPTWHPLACLHAFPPALSLSFLLLPPHLSCQEEFAILCPQLVSKASGADLHFIRMQHFTLWSR